jgi:uncharacterized membrane protein
MSDRISQREARRLRKRVKALEVELRATWDEWRPEYRPGVVIASEPNATAETRTAITTARKLQCRVIAVVDADRIVFFAKRLTEKP